jgi:hypothetical protein
MSGLAQRKPTQQGDCQHKLQLSRPDFGLTHAAGVDGTIVSLDLAAGHALSGHTGRSEHQRCALEVKKDVLRRHIETLANVMSRAPHGRLNAEIERRTNVARIFPN